MSSPFLALLVYGATRLDRFDSWRGNPGMYEFASPKLTAKDLKNGGKGRRLKRASFWGDEFAYFLGAFAVSFGEGK